MALRKDKKKDEDEKKPKHTPTKPKPILKAKGYVAWTAKGFRGQLVERGRYVKCQLPVCELDPSQPNRLICGKKIKNEKRDLQSHYQHMHAENSAGHRDSKKNPSRPWKCPCGKDHESWNQHYGHIRTKHEFRGKSKAVRLAGGLKKFGARLDPLTGKVMEKKENADDDDEDEDDDEDDDDEDDDDEGLFVPPHKDGPRDPKFDDDDPSGAAGGLIQAAA
ncbi:hypothetical protein PG988_013769 [Apiospora saccharicola]